MVSPVPNLTLKVGVPEEISTKDLMDSKFSFNTVLPTVSVKSILSILTKLALMMPVKSMVALAEAVIFRVSVSAPPLKIPEFR